MREIQRCRRCEFQIAGYPGGRRPFAEHGARPHYAPDLPVRLEHLLLDVQVDPKAKVLEGTVTQRVKVIAPNLRTLKLDQVGLQIQEAKVGGQPVKFAAEGDKLELQLPETSLPGATLEVAIRYRVSDPKRGLYFTGPDADYPNKPYQVWSQGQDEDNRYWIPTFDYPNQKATTEVIATVPKGFTAVSNGALVSRQESPAGTRFHYRLGTPHVTYLIALTVAELSHWEDQGPGGVPVQYFVPPGREEDGRRAFGNTPRMIEVFGRKTGVPYPYEKYSQVAVQDFIFGGMENTSATTQTDRTLHDARAHLDFSSDPLVSHELAHQWFGDLLTCRDWSHGWLNEGFATFMERVWIENNLAEYGDEKKALEEAKYYSYVDLKDYLEEDSSKYRRPIVCNTYLEPIDLFDAHLYQKGGLVLNLLRATLGEEAFWKSIQLYLSRHRGQNVETLDLIRAIEDATGRNPRRFFDEWVFSAGHPELEVSYAWHEDRKLAELVIEQKQTGGQPETVKDGFRTPLFHLGLTVELTLEGGRKVSQSLETREARERVFISVPSKPLMVRLDPGNTIPKTLKFPRPKELLLHQLANDPDCMGRIEAAQELGRMAPDAEIVAALGRAAAQDAFWGVQCEVAEVLAGIGTPAARDALIAALATKHPKARRGVVKALGRVRDPKAAAALRPLAEKDPSYFVEADAISAWVGAQARPELTGRSPEAEAMEKFVTAQLAKPSYLDVIRSASLRALATIPGAARGERPSLVETLFEWTRRGKPEDARIGAIAALGQLARSAVPSERARIFALFDCLAEEEGFRIRIWLVHALASTDSTDAVPILEKLHRLEVDGRIRRLALATKDGLIQSASKPESVTQLKSALEKLEEEYRKLRGLVEERRAGL